MVPLQSGKYTNNMQLRHSWKVNINNYQIELFHCRQKSSGWKCFINFRQVTKRYYFKEDTDDFRKFDVYTVYNALNYDAFFFFIVQHSSIVLTRIILRPLSALSLDEGLNALNGKNPSAAVWFSRPIKCHILACMRISDFLYFRL